MLKIVTRVNVQNIKGIKILTISLYKKTIFIITSYTNSQGGDHLPLVMRGPEGLLCFLTRTTPSGSEKVGVGTSFNKRTAALKMRNLLALSWPPDPRQL